MISTRSKHRPTPYISWVKAMGIWVACAVTLWTLHAQLGINVDNLSIGLILAAALASIYLTPPATFVATLVASGLFSMLLIPPIGSVRIKLLVHQELVIFTSLTIAILVGILTSRLRQLMERSQNQATRSHQLNGLREKMHHNANPINEAEAILTLVENTVQAHGAIWCQPTPLSAASQPKRVASHADASVVTAFLGCMDSFVLLYAAYIKHGEDTFLLVPIRGGSHQFGIIALRLSSGRQEVEPSSIDEAIISLDVWAKSIELAWQSVEVQKSKEVAYQRGIHNSLLAAVSHEFRTPLSTILMAASSLTEQRALLSAAQIDDRLNAIGREAKHLRTVTHHILELSKLESGKGSLRKDWESAEELVGIAVRRFASNHPGQQVLTTVAPSMPLVECDQVLVLQLLDNLLENAVQHAGPHAPQLHAWQDATGLRMAVRDEGTGVDNGLIHTLFEPYQTQDRQRNAAPNQAPQQIRRGFGLGLPLCRAIAQAHGGDLVLEYTSAQGSSFLATLPFSNSAPTLLPEEPNP